MRSFAILALATAATAAPTIGPLLTALGGALPSLGKFPYPAATPGCASYTDNFDVAYYNTGIVPVAFSQVTNTTYNGTLFYESFDYVPSYDGGFKAPTGPNVIGAPMLTALLNNGSTPAIYAKPTVKQSAFDFVSLKYACTQGAGLTAIAYPAYCQVRFTGTKAADGSKVTYDVTYNPNGSPKAFTFLDAKFPSTFTGLSRVDMEVTQAYTGAFVTVPLIDQVTYNTCVSS